VLLGQSRTILQCTQPSTCTLGWFPHQKVARSATDDFSQSRPGVPVQTCAQVRMLLRQTRSPFVSHSWLEQITFNLDTLVDL
jgi:hypothetical protein